MLRRATPEALRRLVHAVHEDDRELDIALLSLGILPPLDLSDIRAWLSLADTDIRARTNRDGHRLISVTIGMRTVARIHHDGRVVTGDQAGLLRSV